MSPRNLFFFPKAPWTLIHLLELPKTEHRQFQVLVIMWNNRNSHSLLAGIQNDTAIWKTVQWFLTILNRILPHDLAIALLVFTQKKLKTRPFKNLHMDIYSSFFFIVVKTWYIQAMEYYTALKSKQRRQWHPTPVLLPGKSHGWRSLVGCSPWGKSKALSSHEKTWRKFKCIPISERSQF